MDRVPSNSDFVAEALELIGLPACVCDPAGVVHFANAQFIRLMGHDAAGMDIVEHLSGVTAAQLRAACNEDAMWEAVLLAGEQQVTVQVSARPVPANLGDPGTTLVFNDVRRLSSNHAVLENMLMEQRAMLENAAVGIVFVRESTIREWNMRAAQMLGYGAREMVGEPAHALFPDPIVYAAFRVKALELLAKGDSYTMETQLRRRDGSLAWCRLNGRAINTSQPTSGSIWIIEDIDAQYRSEAKLGRTSLEMQAIMDNAPVAILFMRDSTIERYNQRFGEFFGFEADAGVGSNVAELFPSREQLQEVREVANALLAQGLTYQAEMSLRRQDGSTFWAHFYVYAINAGNTQQETIWIIDDRTAQKAREEATRRLLLEQKAILDNASVGIVFAARGRIVSGNPRIAEMFGYTPEEMGNLAAVDVFPSIESFVEFDREAAPLLGNGLPFEKHEYEFMRRDGSVFWCRVRAKPVDPDDARKGTIWILEDVTEARQRLIEVQAIMTNASISILFTKKRVITRYNRGFAEMFGYDGDEALGLSGRALYQSDEAHTAIRMQSAPLLAKGKPFQGEAEMVRKDGTTLWAQLIAYVVNPEDPSQGTIWILEDRTEQKRAEEELRNALLENQAILDTAVLGIAVVDGGRNLRCNQKMAELFGYHLAEIEGLPVRELYPDAEGRELARSETARDFNAGRASMGEYELVRKDGSRFWARLSGRPFDFSNPRGRSLWLVDDVTQRREAAEAVRRARDELEVRVLERTAELAGANALLQGEIVERRQAEARVHHMAYHDTLTGLPNRALLADRLDRAMLGAQRSERKLAVMFLDLDRFKTINDSLGHLTGDHLLKEVAARLCQSVRASDTVARLGGDEFVVLVPGIRNADESAQVAQKIIDALAAPVPFEGRTLHITPSIGICVYPDDGHDVETLMRHADAAMYHAKASGRNNYQFFTQRMNQAASQYFELESSLRNAQDRNEFELYYQPIMDIETRRVNTLEVLLRWSRPEMGLAMPDQFIPILEENGQIVTVGEWVIRKACEQSMAWLAEGREPVPLAVNLSPRQFMHRGLVDSVRRILDETGIDPSLIEFEITETALMQHGEHTLEVLGQINAMGIRLSIDDFGTGYSSLAYLKRFPVHKVKIDRAFIRDLEDSAEDRAIVAAIIALSDSLQLDVVAEGVETEGQFAQLREQGCDFAQGYLFSQPVPASSL
ncbi:EAL domain-containing protein [Pseudoduganella sp. GCM10020061]|uniref:bifunctional diguanylate cyclase/phosphodiesterase n=1 Tax=Pseudoduganella sp. GCM10020061 TaxID=3317345 RepID=UPI003636E428